MLRSGLVSVTFRRLSPSAIIALVTQAKLQGIEWGGDVHVPHGDVGRASEVRRMTEDAGLMVGAYGSYYRVGESEAAGLPFEQVLETAIALGAPLTRVWAGKRSPAEADVQYRKLVVEDTRRIAEMAAQANIIVAYEFHGGTLTDTAELARELLQAVAHSNLQTLWQPRHIGLPNSDVETVQENLADLEMVLPWLANVHAFYWTKTENGREAQVLADGQHAWNQYLRKVASTEREHYVLLEFVRGESPTAFLEDAETLKKWLSAYSS